MAEIVLRLGCGLVGWMLVFGHAILIAIVPVADCTRELWRVTLLFGALGGIGAALLPAGLAWRGTLRWLALPALPLWGVGAGVVAGLWTGIGGAALCDVLAGVPDPASGEPWQRAWVPLQLVAILAAALQAARFWLPAPVVSDAAEHLAQ